LNIMRSPIVNVLAALLTTGALLGAAGSASAADPATTTFTVTATVVKNCTVSAVPLAFNYTPGAGNVASNTTVTVNCTNGTTFNTELTAGTTAGATIAQRLMTNGTQTLQYNLYTTAGLATPWGTTVGTNTVAATGAGMAAAGAVVQTVYGQVPDTAPNNGEPSGTYTDLITVNVAY
jgi:spore coat protein U-like protein